MTNYNDKIKKRQEEKDVLQRCVDKKLKNNKFREYIRPLITPKMFNLISECGDYLTFLADFEMENRKLYRGNFCKNRFCPMCTWRTSCKDTFKISILMEHLRKEENKEFIFLTLTTPNVKGDKLEEEIINYNKSFDRLMKRKEVKSIVKGYIRKLEVTYQKEQYITKELWKSKKDYYKSKGLGVGDPEPNYDTYNPHFHVVIAVNKSYFKKSDLYINHQRWLELWREATGNSSITQVDIRKSKTNNLKEVYELAKYSAKDTDYLVSRPVFNVFYKALKGKQLIVYGGLFKDANKMYENGELDCYKTQDSIEYVYMMVYSWSKKEYDNTSIRELTPEEKKKFNKKLVDVIEID